jgi:hypothetical protein
MKARACSDVIMFPAGRVRPVRGEQGEALGQVVIFNGVRIERMEEPGPVPKSQGHLLPPRPRRGRRQV